jgi:hypothetical protein
LISIYYHPAEWVHREFWDAVNFTRGANPPREDWKAPRQLARAETEAAFTRFAAYIDFQRSLPGVRHVTATDLPTIYHNRIAEQGADRAAVKDIASRVSREVALDVVHDGAGRALSPADQFALIISFLADAIETGALASRLDVPRLTGPVEVPRQSSAADLPWAAFRDAAVEAAREMRTRAHVPARVFVGATPTAPADFLRAAASVVSAVLASDAAAAPVFPERVAMPTGTRVATERFIAEDSPELFGEWVIHPAGFRAPRLMELARLQAWTLKPAER